VRANVGRFGDFGLDGLVISVAETCPATPNKLETKGALDMRSVIIVELHLECRFDESVTDFNKYVDFKILEFFVSVPNERFNKSMKFVPARNQGAEDNLTRSVASDISAKPFVLRDR
jgi:hypothetical protein